MMCRPINSTAGALMVIGILVNKWDLLETMRIQDILTNLGIYLVTIPERESVVLFYH